MKIIKQIIELVGVFFSYFRKRNPKEVKEFTELVESQYTYLMEIVKTFQKDYFSLSEQVKGMCQEIIGLNRQLKEALAIQCLTKDCKERK